MPYFWGGLNPTILAFSWSFHNNHPQPMIHFRGGPFHIHCRYHCIYTKLDLNITNTLHSLHPVLFFTQQWSSSPTRGTSGEYIILGTFTGNPKSTYSQIGWVLDTKPMFLFHRCTVQIKLTDSFLDEITDAEFVLIYPWGGSRLKLLSKANEYGYWL